MDKANATTQAVREAVDPGRGFPAGPPEAAGAGDRDRDPFPVALYQVDDVRASLGLSRRARPGWADEDGYGPAAARDTEHQCRLADILEEGEPGRWRHALGPAPGTVAALAMRVPMFLAPTLLAGEPGTGKSWALSRTARVLGLP